MRFRHWTRWSVVGEIAFAAGIAALLGALAVLLGLILGLILGFVGHERAARRREVAPSVAQREPALV